MDLIDDGVIPDSKEPIGPRESWDDGSGESYDDYEEVIYDCYK
jgi:hypothetical protein